jgi:hypothetical protein
MTAVPAIAVHATHPGNADSRSERQICGCAFDYLSHDLVARNELRSKRRQISFNDMQIGATDAASNDFEQNMPSFKVGPGSVRDLKELRSFRARGRKDGSFQFPQSFRIRNRLCKSLS